MERRTYKNMFIPNKLDDRINSIVNDKRNKYMTREEFIIESVKDHLLQKPTDKDIEDCVKELEKWLDDEDTEERLKIQKAHIQKLEKKCKMTRFSV